MASAITTPLHETDISMGPGANTGNCGTCLQTALLREGNHRIANSLQIAASRLLIRARQTHSAEARAILNEVADDIYKIGLTHRKLCRVDDSEMIDLGEFMGELCSDFDATTHSNSGVVFAFKANGGDPLYMSAGKAAQIGLILTELLTNCVKHAGVDAKCRVTATATARKLEVEVCDDGNGLPADFRLGVTGRGVGMQVLLSLVSGLNGTIASVPTNVGSRFLVTVPTFV